MSRVGRFLTVAALALGGPLLAAPGALGADEGPHSEERGIPIQVVIPDSSRVELDSAVLTWGINAEVGSGAYFGGCNFLSAGAAGNAGTSRVWTEADGFYKTVDGDVSIQKPDADGVLGEPTWATKCQDPSGATVTAQRVDSRTQNQVVITGGTGEVDHGKGTAEIQWHGSFTVVFYGGMTYWTASDPKLVVQADGTGTLTATGSGYGADMDDPGRWVPLPERPITLATFHDADVAAPESTVITPDYLGVDLRGKVDGITQTVPNESNAAYWGAFPQDFVAFQMETGQSAYWYTSGGSRDRAKIAEPFAVGYGAPVTPPVTEPPGPGTGDGDDPGPSNPLNPRPDGVNPPPSGPVPTGPSTPSPGVTVPTGGTTPTGTTTPTRPAGGGALLPAPAPSAGEQPSGDDGALASSFNPSTVLAAGPGLIPGGTGQQSTFSRWWSVQDKPLLLTSTGVVVLGLGAGLGLAKGWLVLPWLR